MKFVTPYTYKSIPGEVNSGELVTEPGQAFTTREIYERFLVTGRVQGSARLVTYDSDEVQNRDLDFQDNIDRPLDLTDIDEQMNNLYRMRAERIAEAQRQELAKRAASQGVNAESDAVSGSKSE